MISSPTFNLNIVANIALFLILFAMITWLLKKTMFKESKVTLLVISASASILAIYGLEKLNFSIENLLRSLNLSGLFQYSFLIILIIVSTIFLWKKIGLGITLIVVGALLFLVGILNLVYANASIGIVGAILFILGLAIKKYFSRRKKFKEMSLKDQQDYLIKKRK